jgi:hypothetical protein
MKTHFPVRSIWLALGAAVVFVPVTHGQGRQQLGNSDQIEKEYKKISFEFDQEAMGTKPPVAEHLDIAAKYFVYRVTWVGGANAKSVSDFVDLVDRRINGKGFGGPVKGANDEFKKLWSKALVGYFHQLTDLALIDNAKEIVHGCQMFPALARMKQEVVGVYLQELIDEKGPKPGHDAIRLYALRALGELLPVTPWNEPQGAFDPTSKKNLARKAQELARIDVLTRFIHRPAPTPPDPDTIEAFRFVRREAIEALARGGSPAVNSSRDNANAKMEGPIAVTLMEVLVPGNLNPPATLAERNEAALGLCSLKGTATYDGKATLPFIAMTLVDMNRMYAEDFPDLKEKPQRARFAWKIEGARWKKALEILADAKDGPFSKDEPTLKLAQLLASEKMAGGMGGMVERWRMHQGEKNQLDVENFAKTNLPAIGPLKLFKGIASPPIQWQGLAPPEAAAAAGPKE